MRALERKRINLVCKTLTNVNFSAVLHWPRSYLFCFVAYAVCTFDFFLTLVLVKMLLLVITSSLILNTFLLFHVRFSQFNLSSFYHHTHIIQNLLSLIVQKRFSLSIIKINQLSWELLSVMWDFRLHTPWSCCLNWSPIEVRRISLQWENLDCVAIST